MKTQLYPTIEDIRGYAAEGAYDIVPVRLSMLSDAVTPIEAMRRLRAHSNHCFLLESAQANETWGRYTFLGYEPVMAISCLDGRLTVDGHEEHTEHPSAYLREVLSHFRAKRVPDMPPFCGGLVGYFSYDYIGYSEPVVRGLPHDREGFCDVDVMLFDTVIAFDNVRQKIDLITNIPLSDADAAYEKAKEKLLALRLLLLSDATQQEPKGRLMGEVTPAFDEAAFSDMIAKAKEHIREGDIFQIVLSNCLSAPFEGNLFHTYRLLRTINPSPYMFYLDGTDVEVAGASPETLVKLEDGILHTFPLAGTRPRGKTKAEDQALEEELLADEKELAEHNMLVDLGRNDIGKIAKFHTVEVEKLREIQRFSHVMHIGSTVRGEIREDKDALDAIEAVLPAGTLSGAPKIRACQLIAALEDNKRGIYGGAIGYIDFTGNMDTCIAIRLIYRKGGKVFVRSGAGIVADSDPKKEYEECINKAKAALTALLEAQEDVL